MEQVPIPNQPPEKPSKSPEQKDRDTNLRIIKYASINAQHGESELSYQTDGTEYWDVYDSSCKEFERNFKEVLPAGGFQEFIDTHYGNKKGSLIAMELGGPASKLFEGFEPNIFKETVGVSLNDLRTDKQKASDEKRHHNVLEADVFSIRPNLKGYGTYPARQWATVKKWTEEHGRPDIIIERMLGGIDMVRRKKIFLAILNRWYKLLAPEGTIFFEAPKNHHKTIPISEYKKELERIRACPYLEFKSNTDTDPLRPFAMIRKLPGAPESLNELLKHEK